MPVATVSRNLKVKLSTFGMNLFKRKRPKLVHCIQDEENDNGFFNTVMVLKLWFYCTPEKRKL